jgi:hypothetical protein
MWIFFGRSAVIDTCEMDPYAPDVRVITEM